LHISSDANGPDTPRIASWFGAQAPAQLHV